MSRSRVEELEATVAKLHANEALLRYELDIYSTASSLTNEDLIHAAEVEVRNQHLEREVERYQQQVTALGMKCEHLVDTCSSKAAHVETLERKIAALGEARELSSAERESAFNAERIDREVIHGLREELLEKTDTLATVSDECQALRESLQQEHLRRNEAEAKVEELHTEVKLAVDSWREGHRELMASQKRYAHLQSQATDLRHDAEVMQKRLLNTDAELMSLRESCALGKSENIALRKELLPSLDGMKQAAAAREELVALETRVRDYQKQIDVLHAEVSKGKAELNGLVSERDTARDRCHALQRKESELESQLTSLENSLGLQVRSLKEENQKLRNESVALRERAEGADNKATTLSMLASHRSSVATSARQALSDAVSSKLAALTGGTTPEANRAASSHLTEGLSPPTPSEKTPLEKLADS